MGEEGDLPKRKRNKQNKIIKNATDKIWNLKENIETIKEQRLSTMNF